MFGLPKGPSYPRHSLLFFAMLPPNQSSVISFSCPPLAHLCLLILFLLTMSGNVHPNLGLIFPCSVCAGNVTWWGKSVQCCICSKWVHLRCSQLSLFKFRTLYSSHSWSCPTCCVPTCNTVSPSSDSSDMYTGCFTILSDFENFIKQKVNKIKSKFQSSSIGNIMLFLHMHQHAANLCKFCSLCKPLIPRRPILYLLLPPQHCPLLLAWLSFYASCLLFSP